MFRIFQCIFKMKLQQTSTLSTKPLIARIGKKNTRPTRLDARLEITKRFANKTSYFPLNFKTGVSNYKTVRTILNE